MEELGIGDAVDGRFKLDRFLGEGGMGAVWAAHHLVTGKRVALKILKGAGDEQRRRFVQEARVAAAIRHPNVVDIHDVIELRDGRPALVMDLLEGEPLSCALARDASFAPTALARIMLPVLAGVGAAHSVGIVHRDLKPENVFLCKGASGEVTVKVLDFGIAKLTALSSAIRHTAALTQTGSVLGTPMYMAPEQVFGEKGIDHRADIWSLGVVMYECLTGSCPVEGDNVGQIFKSISQRTFPSLRERLPDLAPGIAELVDAMLAVKPEDRPDSTRLVAERLAFHTGLETPSIAEPRWLPGSHRRAERAADPLAPTETHAALARAGGFKRLRVAGAAALLTLAVLLGWRLSAGARSIEAPASAVEQRDEPPVVTATSLSESPLAPERSIIVPAIAPSTTASARTTSSSVIPAATPAMIRQRPSDTGSTKPPAGPGGIHEVSPY